MGEDHTASRAKNDPGGQVEPMGARDAGAVEQLARQQNPAWWDFFDRWSRDLMPAGMASQEVHTAMMGEYRKKLDAARAALSPLPEPLK